MVLSTNGKHRVLRGPATILTSGKMTQASATMEKADEGTGRNDGEHKDGSRNGGQEETDQRGQAPPLLQTEGRSLSLSIRFPNFTKL